MTDTQHLTLDEVSSLATEVLLACGFSTAQASAIAATVTAAERDDCKSHGLFRIPFYVNALKNPATNAAAEPMIAAGDSSVIHVDALEGFCPLALQIGIVPLIEKTREQGIAALAIHNAYNIAALWPEVEQLAEQQLVAFAFTVSNAYVAPAGGTQPVYGTNPMAFAWPRSGRPPLVFDQASSACARGEIQLHLRDGKPIPDGWAIDRKGRPTNDPQAALEGAQLPFGGHKGAAIALMIELLAGALIGDLFSYESSSRDTQKVGAPFGGELLLAIDPAHCVVDSDTAKQQARAEVLFEKILAQEGTRLPSERRYTARARNLKAGIDIPQSLYKTLQDYLV